MAANFAVFLLTFALCFVFTADGQTNQSVIDTGSNSGCVCDLIVNGCDPNCCCDVDCSASDKESFNECVEAKNVIFDDRTCVSDQTIFIKNVPFTTKNTGDGLLCIYHNNNQGQAEYSDVSVIMSNEDFTESIHSRNVYSYEVQNGDTNGQKATKNYKVGDKIILVFPNHVKGNLALPTMLGSSSCNDYNAAGYFQNDDTACARSFSDLSLECSNSPALSAPRYYSNFQVAMSPQALVFSTNTTSNSSTSYTSYNMSLLLTPQLSLPLWCQDSTGMKDRCSFTTPPVPVYNASTKTCENVVTEVAYTFVYSNETSNLKQLNVSFVLQNIQENFLQKFSIRFLKEGHDNVFMKSGNPGYLVDQPILAGRLANQADKKAIILSTNRKEWLTVPKATLDGSCTEGVNDRLSVTFKMNARSGCMIRLNQSNDCSLLQDIILKALLGTSPPDYVASFGNSDVSNAADWVKIIEDERPGKGEGSGSICSNMVLGMNIEILFANVGYLANPQAKIVGVRFKYEKPQTITYQCVGQFCSGRSSASQFVEVVSSVSFIDVSQPPISDQKSLPEFQSKAPSDFFHPFL